MYLVISRTRIGALVRAGVDDQEMVMTIGVNVNRLFLAVFMVGSGLAGLAGVLGSSFLTLYPGAGSDILTLALVVVIVGGVGSVEGAIVGSLAVGLISTYSNAFLPDAAYFSIFVPMVLILLWKPEGLLGRKVDL
jgi:branched-chain amino acid transport system permease protein